MPHHPPKQQASAIGLSRDQVREFGSLSRRATWESAIAFRRATNGELDRWKELENVDNVIHTALGRKKSESEVEAIESEQKEIVVFPKSHDSQPNDEKTML